MSDGPLISILAPTFNCESYVCAMIDSFLSQTYGNFELIIVDDCSSDTTVEKIRKYNDPRIKLILHDWNKGVNFALNTAFYNSKGDYIAFAAGDDMVKPTYCANAIKQFQTNKEVGVLYTSLILIDELGEIIKPQPAWRLQKRRSREDLLNEMFYTGNALLSPGMIVKRDVLQDCMPLNPALSTYQDYFMHVNFLIRTDAGFFPDAEYYYRRSSGSLSARRDSYFRESLETPILMNSFLQIQNIDFLKRILRNDSIEMQHTDLIPYYIGVSALNSEKVDRQQWGYRTLLDFISVIDNYEKLNRLTGFLYKHLLDVPRDLWSRNKKISRYKRVRRDLIVVFAVLSLCFIWSLIIK